MKPETLKKIAERMDYACRIEKAGYNVERVVLVKKSNAGIYVEAVFNPRENAEQLLECQDFFEIGVSKTEDWENNEYWLASAYLKNSIEEEGKTITEAVMNCIEQVIEQENN